MIISRTDFKIQMPCRGLLCGPSNSGKTRLIKRFIEHREQLFSQHFDQIIYCHPHKIVSNIDQQLFQELEDIYPPIEFIPGLPDLKELMNLTGNTLLILEDMIDLLISSSEYSNLFSVYSSHYNISILTTSQNYFQHGKFAKTVLRNQSFLILFETRNDRQSANIISRQMFPGRSQFITHCFNWLSQNIINRVDRYLYVECASNSPLPGNFPQIRTNIFLETKKYEGILAFTPNTIE